MLTTDFKAQAWVKRLDFLALSGWFVLSLTLAVISFELYGMDFRGYYAAARVLTAGGNPYDYNLVSQELLLITGEMGNNPYYYPPWFAWFFVPLATLPYQIARMIWMAFNTAVWIVSLWHLGSLIGWPPMGWRRYTLFALTTFSFAWITWRYEQAGILIFAILILIIGSVQGEKWIRSGVWMALLLIKPNITLVVIVGICLWLLLRRHWQPVVVMVLVLVGLLILATVVTPDWYQPFFSDGFGQGLHVVLDGPELIVAQRINSTLLDWLAIFGLERRLSIAIYGMITLAGMITFLWSVFRSRTILHLVGMLLLVSYSITPYVLQYDFPPLAIVLFFWGALCNSSSKKTQWVGLMLAGFVLSVIFWQQNIAWAYWMVIGLIVLMIWGEYQERISQVK
jgi:hypothetical protein